jgi:Icc-related predicted phosphoesterase
LDITNGTQRPVGRAEDETKMRITMTADLHGHFPETPGGDLLIVAGDLTARDEMDGFENFHLWMHNQNYRKKVYIAGNHDMNLKTFLGYKGKHFYISEAEYLEDSGIEFDGVKIWGTPWSKYFDGINPFCKAFMKTDKNLVKYYDKIPDDTDILISHGPPFDILDESYYDKEKCGSQALLATLDRVRPKVFVCGHIHEGNGFLLLKHEGPNTACYNVSHMNVHYKPVNPVVTIDL